MLRLVLAAAPRLVPFDLERFLEVHFTKVGAQTRLFLDDWIRAGADVGRTRTHLEALRVGLEERR